MSGFKVDAERIKTKPRFISILSLVFLTVLVLPITVMFQQNQQSITQHADTLANVPTSFPPIPTLPPEKVSNTALAVGLLTTPQAEQIYAFAAGIGVALLVSILLIRFVILTVRKHQKPKVIIQDLHAQKQVTQPLPTTPVPQTSLPLAS